MKLLNNEDNFIYAGEIAGIYSLGKSYPGSAKVSIGGECFWVRDCKINDDGVITGLVDNDLVCTDVHGLSFGDEIHFKPHKASN